MAAKIVEDIFARSKGIENTKALGAPRRTASFAIVDRYDDKVEIKPLDGEINEGDLIVTTGQAKLVDGRKLDIREK